jgi:hypothetical protein
MVTFANRRASSRPHSMAVMIAQYKDILAYVTLRYQIQWSFRNPDPGNPDPRVVGKIWANYSQVFPIEIIIRVHYYYYYYYYY